ncbi:MAG: hypothetical protein HYZ26_03470 [Chloroflexi bacterium]|nr:hypothetical protein [Chloroflexota bacterium]
MRLFYACMGSALEIFHNLNRCLGDHLTVEAASYSLSDRRYSLAYLARHAPLTAGSEVIRVWELVERGRRRRPGPQELADWEARLGIPSLWPALVADRRTYNGRLTKVRQDYAPYLSLAEMQGVVVEGLETTWAAFERLRPDAVIGFAPSFFELMLIFWVARAQGIPYLYLRSTKIGNYVKLGSDPLERRDPYTEARYRQYLARLEPDDEAVGKARAYIAAARQQRVTYEGGLVRRKRPGLPAAAARFGLYALPMLAKDLLHAARRTPFDMHHYPAFAVLRENTLGQAARIARGRRAMRSRLRTIESLEAARQPYVFYPLHTEPEIATSVFARFHLNQIEVARNLAQSLPLGSLLAVKEHPRSWGLRPPGYYRKMAEIPNLVFIDPDKSTARVIQGAQAVAVLSGFVGFEAALAGVPVIVLGNTFTSLLPESMVRRVPAWEDLPGALRDLTTNYAWDEHALTALVAALMADAVPVNLWGDLLGKAGREHGTGAEAAESDVEEQYRRLAAYVARRLQDPELMQYQVKP